MSKRQIVIALYPGVTHLDFTGPHQVLVRTPDTEVTVASLGGIDIQADGLTFAGLTRFEDIEACDLLCIPGGFGTADAMLNAPFMAQIRRLAEDATWVTSVCTGSLILAAAGLLKGRRAACHWAWRDQLSLFGAIPDPARVVRDGRYVTGGGVTAGIDFALEVAAELFGAPVAQRIQLAIEYRPDPPFASGSPHDAPGEVLQAVVNASADALARRRAIVERISR